MGSNEEKRSMAHYVQAPHIRTRERLAKRAVYPVPKKGDIIIYNEQQKYHEKRDSFPQRGVATVTGVYGYNVYLNKMHDNGKTFSKAIRIIDFELGLYTYVELERLPDECPVPTELEIENLTDELKALVKTKKSQAF